MSLARLPVALAAPLAAPLGSGGIWREGARGGMIEARLTPSWRLTLLGASSEPTQFR